MQLHDLETAALSDIRALYKTLSPASIEDKQGTYQAQFIGPLWIRVSAQPSLFLSGLPGWYGKRFKDAKSATNILIRGQTKTEKLDMQCADHDSLIDGLPTSALSYGAQGPIPWRWVIDEFRRYDDQTLLCMTIIQLPILRHFPFPFLLRRAS